MAEDLYDDGAGMEEPGAVAPEAAPEPEKDSEGGAATSLLPKDFFGGKELKPGVRCEVEVARVTDGQVLVKKVPESEYKASPEPESMMDAMMD